MPMQRELYPDDWESLALAVKDAADWHCSGCGKQCYRPGQPAENRQNVLTVAHLDHNPANCATTNLKALCSVCHLRYDMATRRTVTNRHFFDWRQPTML